MGNLEFTIKNSDFETDKKTNSKSASIRFEGYKAMILHPSFCCPAVAEKGKVITIFLATSDDFYKAYNSEIEGGEALHIDKDAKYNAGNKPSKPIAGALCKRIINQSLNITPWEEISKLNDIVEYKPNSIYASFKEANDSMTVTYISELSSPNGVIDKEGNIFANIRPSAFERITGELNLKHLFQVDLMNLDLESTLYDLSWITLNEEPLPEKEASDQEKSNKGAKENQEDVDPSLFYEVQDKCTREFLITPPNKTEFPHQDFQYAFKIEDDFAFNIDETAPIQNHHPLWIAPTGKARLNIGHLSDSHLSAREFVYKKCNAQIIPGVDEKTSPKIGDLVNNNYSSFKDLLDQMGNDKEIDILILTGDLVDHNRNYNPKNMFFSGQDRTTGEIWEQFSLRHFDKKFDDGTQKYPSSIDNVLIYSLFRYFYSTYNKPIFLVNGNHEFYKFPYGISPRIKLAPAFWNLVSGRFRDDSTEKVMSAANEAQAKANKKRAEDGKDDYADGQKANDGIPADHNLTFYEATLMYGPDYNALPAGSTGKGNAFNNFVPDTVDWFFQIFSPFSDYFFKYNDQTFIGLEWGENEQLIFWATDNQIDPKDTPIKVAGGVLPRACEAINDNQKLLIETALKTSNDKCNILFSHFTYTAFFPSIPHSDVGITNICGKHEFGTFHKNKDYIYLDLIKNHKLHYTLSGHTHRPGLYQLTSDQNEARTEKEILRKQYKEMGFELVEEKETLYVKPNEIDITTDNNVIYSNLDKDKTKMLVSSCSGPTGKFNAQDELYGLGMDYPSGSYIKFSENEEHIGMIRPKDEKVSTAKPRFAVALEYADIIGAKNHHSKFGIFREFILSDDAGHIFIELNPDLRIPSDGNGIFKSIELFFVKKNKTKSRIPYTFSQKSNTSRIVALTSTKDKKSAKEVGQRISKSKLSEYAIFICIKFNSLNHYKEFNHYNFDTPLVIRVSLESFKERIDQNIQKSLNPIDEFGIERQSQTDTLISRYSTDSGFFVCRDKKNGEVPDHYKLTKFGGTNYSYNWENTATPDK